MCENEYVTYRWIIIFIGIRPATLSFLCHISEAPEAQNVKHLSEIKYHLNGFFSSVC